jgi:ribosomal protein S27E
LGLYRPRNPQASGLWRVIDEHFETFQQVYDERFAAKYGFWRPVVERSVTAFLKCGDLHEGFARVRCPDCHHEMFVAFSCKQRCTCPSCHQKRALLTAIHVAEEVCSPVAHRQVVFTIPKRLRVHTRFDRKLLGKLCSCAWTCVKAEIQRVLGRDDVLPGMIATIQTHGELLHWHPHIHALVTCGAFTPSASPRPLDGRGAGGEGEFLEVPALDIERLKAAWQEAVFALYLAKDKIEPEVVDNMRTWPHSGFSVDQSVYLPAGDKPGIERLTAYMTRCPFSLSRLVKVTETGQVVYKAEKDACRAFPEPQGNDLARGPKRNFQVLSPLEFLAEFTQHIPPTGSHLIRYYGWYSNKARGMRRKRQQADAQAATAFDAGLATPPFPGPVALELPPRSRASQTWAMLIQRVYEVDPLACPKCGGRLKVVAFIEPPQADVIEKILRHCGLWNPPPARPPPAADASVHDPDEPRELTYVDIDTFEATLWADF